VGWSIFLIYFFGFFGVSFVHNDVEQDTSAAATTAASATTDATATPSKGMPDMDPSVVSKKALSSSGCNITSA
jgi:hypothetical protein